MMQWIIDNKEWIFSGIGVLGVSVLIAFFGKKSNGEINNSTSNTNTNNNKQEQNLYIQLPYKENDIYHKVKNSASLKETIHILFVDDQRFNMVNLLKSAGWKNVSYKKDITNIDCEEVLWAHFLFVDINGVGSKLFNNQGLGLGAAIKAKYPSKKVVIYSAEPTGDRFDMDLRKVDDCILKNAEPIQFSNLIEELCNE